ncbi:hypothetical protein D910_00273 [Dendroctonus ponderosae]|uniref:Uncharacterized protein n=1 Tax=Dendroctonus ponderosae TaxID=77166 RepID=U4TRN1_DENPD|nr:hypothetical protein D910_00273 [Dendroctonus ponderosae]
MVPYKRPAADKSGVPVYQPNATTYQQLMQLQQPFVPVSSAHPAGGASLPAVSMAMTYQLQQPAQQPQPPPLQPNQFKKEADPQISLPASVTTTASLNSLPAQSVTVFHDPAALAKEVAQQNYAKAVKLAAMNQSLANSQMSHLNPLNYTGVALNKQALSMPPPAMRYANLPLGFGASNAGLNLGLAAHPYSAALAQQNFFNIARPPPAATPAAFQFNPYSIMRPGAYASAPTTGVSAAPMISGGLLGAQYPTVTVSAAPMTTVSPSAASIAAAAAQNNNNVVMQPFKKLKTS